MPQNIPYTQEFLVTSAPPRRRWPRLDRSRILRAFEATDVSTYSAPETLEQVIQRLHRRQKFYLTHAKDLPSW